MTEAQLRVLTTVAELGGFSLAASELQMSQPGVSRAVASLEEELGAPLLVRTRGAASLTPLGRRVVVHAREMLARAEAMRQDASLVSGSQPTQLRIASLPSLSARLLPTPLAELHDLYPAIEVVVREAADDTILRWLRERTVDVGIVARPAPDLDVRPLATTELRAVLPDDHPLADQPAVTPAAFDRERLVTHRGGFERLIADELSRAGAVPGSSVEVGDHATALGLVAGRLGVSIVPDLLLDAMPSGVTTRPLDPPTTLDLGYGVSSLAAAPEAALAFLRIATASPADRAHPPAPAGPRAP